MTDERTPATLLNEADAHEDDDGICGECNRPWPCLVARLAAYVGEAEASASNATVAALRTAVTEYLEADAEMPEFADAQRMDPAEWDRRTRRWSAADVALRAAFTADAPAAPVAGDDAA